MADSSHRPDDKPQSGRSASNGSGPFPQEGDFRNLLDSLPSACIFAVEKEITYANPAALQLLRAESADDVIGRPAADLVPPEDREWFFERLSALMQGRRLPAHERRIRALDDSLIDVEVESTLVEVDGRRGLLATVREIAQRKQLRAAYRNLVENSLQGFLVVQEGRVMFANQAVVRISGRPLEEILGMSVNEVVEMIDQEDRPTAAANWSNRESGSTAPSKVVYCVRRPDGQQRWVECLYSSTQYLGADAWQVALTDVTDRIQAERALRESEERFRTIFEQSTIGIYRTTPDGEILMANPAMVRMLGYGTFEELARRNLTQEGYEPNYPRSEFTDRMRSSGRVDGLEAAWKKRDGTTIYVRESAQAVRDESGRILFYDGTVEDITRRRMAEQKIEAEHRRLLSVFDGLDAVIYVCDPTTHELLYMNPAAAEQWGEANGRKCFEVLQGRSDPCPFCTNDRIFSAEYDGRSYVWEHQNETNKRWYRCTDKAITWPDGRRVRFETAIDITNERRLAEEMTKAEKLESIGVLAGGIAHDFNNLLTGILGNISLARADIGAPSDHYSIGELLEQAEDAAMRARSLTQQLLTFSRGGAPVTAVTSIQSLLRECSEFVLAGTAARCRFDLADDLKLVEVDEGQLSQVVANLVLNADQAMSDGGEVLISARNVSLESDNRLPLPAGHYVRISVRDRGVGIPPENISRIFDPFFTTREFGRGLGLTTSFTIVRKHGGHLGVESQPGHGSTFHVYLPVSTTETEVAPRRAVAPPRGTGNILVVDDEEAVRNVAEITLSKLGYQVTTTASGEEAVEVLRQVSAHGGSFDVTVVDLTMPGGIDGVEAFRRMRAIDPTLCGVVSSGYANSSVMSSYRDYGFSGAIDKPYTFTRLADAVQSALRETPAGGSDS